METEDKNTGSERREKRDTRGLVVGEMSARRETMADGKRYIVYYTFADGSPDEPVANAEEDSDV